MFAPTRESYWVEPGRFLAGKYPGSPDTATALLDAGVSLFLDLTEPGELESYAGYVGEAARRVRMPISDMGVTTAGQMARTLDLVDHELGRGGVVYVHCFGGAGRTGTVVGCWLVRHGLDGAGALARIAALRAGSPALWLDSPQTEEQRAMVHDWAATA